MVGKFLLSKAKGNWILYVDADEGISAQLRDEIEEVTGDDKQEASAFAVPRRYFCLVNGRNMLIGGRIFK